MKVSNQMLDKVRSGNGAVPSKAKLAKKRIDAEQEALQVPQVASLTTVKDSGQNARQAKKNAKKKPLDEVALTSAGSAEADLGQDDNSILENRLFAQSTSGNLVDASGAPITTAGSDEADGRLAWWPMALLGAAGAAFAVGAGGSSSPTPTPTPEPKVEVPPAPTGVGAPDTDSDNKPEATGTAEPNSTVTVTWPDGTTSTTVANASGVFNVESPTTQANNGTVSASATNASGSGLTSTATYKDTTAPTAPTGVGAPDTDSDNKPEATGTAEPNSTVTVTWPDGTTSTTVANASGVFNVESPKTQANNGTISASATDAAGNTSPTATATYKDTTAPTAPVGLGAPDTDGDKMPEATGTAEPNSTVTVTWPDGTTSTTVANASGVFNVESPKTQAPNATISASATDAAGNKSPTATATYADNGAPAAPIGLGAPDTDSDNKPEATGTAEPNSTVTVTWPDGTTSTAVANASGVFNVESPKTQADNSTISASATDAGGNTSPTATAMYQDTTAPTDGVITNITFMDDFGADKGSIVDGSTIDDTKPTYAGVISSAGLTNEGVKTVNIYDNGTLLGSAAVNQTTGAWSFEPATDLVPGAHAFTVAAVDAAGNVGPQVSGTSDAAWNFTLSGVVPAPAEPQFVAVVDNYTHGDDVDTGTVQKYIAATDNADGYTNDTTLTVNGVGTPNTLVTLYATNAAGTKVAVGSATVSADQKWTIDTTALGADGVYGLSAKATNSAGVSSSETGLYNVKLDTTVPAAVTGVLQDDQGGASTVAAGGTTDDATPTVTGTGEIGAKVAVYLDGSATPAGTATVGTDGKWSVQLATLADGAHSFTTKVTDVAGNETKNTTPVTFTVNTAAVVVTIKDALDNVLEGTSPVQDGGKTNDTTPTLQGTATPNAVVVIKEGTTVLGSTTADASGNWTFPIPEIAAQGPHTYTASSTNPAGTTGSADFTLVLDSIKPTQPAIVSMADDAGTDQTTQTAPNGVTDDQTPTFSGTGEPGATITLMDKGVVVGTTTVGTDGKWTYTPTAQLPEGMHSITVTATDPSGNVSDPSAPWPFEIDITPPKPGIDVTTMKLTDDVTPVTGNLPDGASTNDTQPTYSGTVTGGAANTDRVKYVNIYDNGTLVGTATVQADGTWSYTSPTPLAEGSTHAYTAAAVDTAGNAGAQVSGTADAAWNFTIDTIKPDASDITAIDLKDDIGAVKGTVADGATIDDALPTYSGVITAAGLAGGVKTVNVYDNGTLIGSAAVGTDGKWSFEPTTALALGDHAFTVTAVDAAGNESTPAKSGTSDAAWNFTLIGGEEPAEPAIASVVDNFTQGDDADVGAVQKYDAAKTDAANAGANTNDTTLTVNGTGTAGSVVTVYATNAAGAKTAVGTATVNSAGDWTVTTTALGADGIYGLSAKATNAAGVSSTETGLFNVKLDTAAPAAVTGALQDDQGGASTVAAGGTTDDATPTVTGTGEIGATVAVYLDGSTTAVGTAVVAADGKWSLAVGTLTDGSHSFTTKITDLAGNETKNSTPVTFKVDTTAILVSIDSALDDVLENTAPVADGGKTNDTTPTLEGSSNPNAVVIIKEGTTVLGSTTADAAGKWTFTVPAITTQGTHTYEASTTNAAGVTGSDTFAVVLDSIKPAQPAIVSMGDDVGTDQTTQTAPNGVTDDQTPTFSGTGEPGSTITLFDNGTPVGTTTVGTDGKWTYTPTTQWTEGPHSVTVTATDPSGNVSDPSAPWPFEIDITAPNPGIDTSSIKLNDDVAPVTGTLPDGASTNDTKPTYSGSVTGGAANTDGVKYVNIYDNGTLVGTATVQADGTWSYTSPTDLAEGSTHAYTAAAVDKAGNAGSQVSGTADAAWNFTIDTTKPNASDITSINLHDSVGDVKGTVVDGSTIDDQMPTYSGTITPAGLAGGVKTVNVYDNGTLIGSAAVDQTTGAWSFEPTTPLAGGDHAFTVTAVDAAGNESTPAKSGTADAAWNFTLDIAAPGAVAIVSVNDDKTHGTTADVGAIQPYVVLDDNKAGYTNDDTLTVIGTAGNNNIVTLYATNAAGTKTAVGSVAADASGNWTITAAALGADGVYGLSAIGKNAAGNVSAETGLFNVKLDTTLPTATVGTIQDDQGTVATIPSGGVTDDNAPVISGTATGEAGATVELFIDGNTTPFAATATVGADGKWSIQLATLTDGAHSITTKITDKAGNETLNSTPTTFTVNTAAVAVDITAAQDDVLEGTTPVTDGGKTNDTTPVLEGTSSLGATVVISEGGTVLGNATVDTATGKWTFALPTIATQGAHTYTATATNSAGNTATDTFVLNLDSIKPTAADSGTATLTDDVGAQVGTVVDASTIDDATPTYSGTIPAAGLAGGITSVNVYDNGTIIGSAAVNSTTGAWTFTPTTPLAAGAHAFTYAAVDASGNVGDPVSGLTSGNAANDAAWNFTLIDTLPGVVAIDSVTDNLTQGTDADVGALAQYAGATGITGYTNDATLTVKGSGTTGDIVTVYATNVATGVKTAVGSTTVVAGEWTLDTAALGADGAYNLTAQAKDAAGALSPVTAIFAVMLDTAVPAAVTGVAQDDVTLQGSPSGAIAASGTTDDNTPTITGTAPTTEAGSTVQVYVDGSTTPLTVTATVAADGTWSIQLPTLADGAHSFVTKITDKAGNESANSAPVNLTVNTSTVEVEITQAQDNVLEQTTPVLDNGSTNDNTPVLEGTTTGTVVTITEGTTTLGTATIDPTTGKWTFALPTIATEGAHTYTATATNAAGKTATDTFVLNLDTVKPTAPTFVSLKDDVGRHQYTALTEGSVTDDQTPTFAGTAEAGAIVMIYDNGTLLGSATADATTGVWTYTHPAQLLEGAHTVTATAKDAAGNTSDISTGWDFVVDITAPGVGVSSNTGVGLTGKTEAGALVVVTNAAGTTFTAVADEEGIWNIAPNPLALNEVGSIKAIDRAGNEGTATPLTGAALGDFNMARQVEQINTYTDGTQINPSVAVLSNGTIVFTWQSNGAAQDNSGAGVYMQIMDPTLQTKIGTEQQVNQSTTGNQINPQIEALTDGSYVIVWQSESVDGVQGNYSTFVRHYSAEGAALSPELLVKEGESGFIGLGNTEQYAPAVTALNDGGYVISWTQEQDGEETVYQTTYNKKDEVVVQDFVVASAEDRAHYSEMDTFSTGDYVTVYEQATNGFLGVGLADDGWDVFIQLHDAEGNLLNGTPISLPVANTQGTSVKPDVKVLKDNSFVVTYSSYNTATTQWDTHVAHYMVTNWVTGTVALSPSGDFVANSTLAGEQYHSVVVDLKDGGYMVFWSSEDKSFATSQDGDGAGVFGQRFSANDQKVGREFLVNVRTDGNQGETVDNGNVLHTLDADLMADGNVVVTWQDNGTDINAVVVDIDSGFYSEERVNTTVANDQRNPSTTYLPGGGWVVVWQSQAQDSSAYGIYGQVFDNQGYKIGNEFLVNSTVTTGDQINPSVVTLTGGDFLVTWQSNDNSIFNNTDSEIYMRRYNPDGTPDSTSPAHLAGEVRVNTTQVRDQTVPEVTALNDGGWMIVWQSYDDTGLFDNTEWQVRAQRYTATGALNGGEMLIASGDDDQDTPETTTLKDGNVVVVWEDYNDTFSANQDDVRFSIYNPATGAVVVNDRIALQVADGTQRDASVTALSDGRFVITWQSDENALDQDQNGIVARIFNAQGNPTGDEFLVNTTTTDNQRGSVVVADPNTGGFVVLWESAMDPAPSASSYGIYMQAYDANGRRVGQELMVNQIVFGTQTELAATFTEGGQLYVTWTDEGVGDTNGSAVKGRVVDVDTTINNVNAASATGPVNEFFLNNQANPSITTLTDGSMIVVWQSEEGFLNSQDDSLSGVYMQKFDATGKLKLGDEQQIHQTTVGDQRNPQVQGLSDGSYVVVWESFSTGGVSSVYVRHFSPAGVAWSTEILVAEGTAGFLGIGNVNQLAPSVTALTNGGYVVSWTQSDTEDVVYQTVYNNDNTVAVANNVVGSGEDYARRSEMDTFSTGQYVTVYEQDANSGIFNPDDGWDLFIQLHAANGNKLNGTPISLPVSTDQGSSLYPDVTVLKNNDFIVTYNGYDNATSEWNVHVVRYTVTDWTLGLVAASPAGDFVANTYLAGSQSHPTVVALDDGGYMVIWASVDNSFQTSQDGDNNGIFAQRYDANDMKVGREFMVNINTAGNQGADADNAVQLHTLDATLMKDGSVMVTWQSENTNPDNNGLAIEAVKVDINAGFHSEERVNTTTANDQTLSSVTYLKNGGWVNVWTSQSQDTSGLFDASQGVYGQIFNADGSKFGNEFRVNNTVEGDQRNPQVITLADGDFVVTWQSFDPTAFSPLNWDIMTRRYNADGTPDISNPAMLVGEVKVNTTTDANQTLPAVTALKDGGWLVTWQSDDESGDANNIWLQQYSAAGALVGGNVEVASGTEDQDTPTTTTLANGNVVIAWEHFNGTFAANQDDIHFSIYNPTTGLFTVTDRVANQELVETQRAPSVTALPNGNFVMTWYTSSAFDQSENGVLARIFDATGNPVTDEFLVNTTTTFDQSEAMVVTNPNDGGFVVVWQGESDPAPGTYTYGVFAQAYDAMGNRRGQEITVHQIVYGNQTEVAATFTTNNELLVSWTDYGAGDQTGSAIKERLLDIEQIIEDLETVPALTTNPTDGIHTLPYNPATTPVVNVVGTASADVLDARGSTTISAGGGDDLVVIRDTNFTTFAGGAGTDTLVWDGYLPLNLSDIDQKTTGVEVIRLSDTDTALTSSDVLTVAYADIVAISDTDTLRVTSTDAASGDTLNINNGGVALTATVEVINGVSYNAYNLGGTAVADLLVQQGITVTVI